MLFLTSFFLHLTSASLEPAPVRRHEETGTTVATSESVTAVSMCHLHDTSVFCMVGATEYHVDVVVTATSDLPAQYTGCHDHGGSETYCLGPDGNDVEITLASEANSEDDGQAGESTQSDTTPDEEHCHFHAGVEHCVGGSGEQSSTLSCERVDRDYNVPLRIGMLFAVLATSAIGVFAPLFVSSFKSLKPTLLTIVLKQFGNGIIISTALIHLLAHASLMFNNRCLGRLSYEATPAAIFLAGICLSFIIEFVAKRALKWQTSKATTELSAAISPKATRSVELLNVTVLEAGIIFHSLIIGLTLVVAGDSYFITLTIVIIFHQMFEGIALGTRIAALGKGHHPPPLQTTFHGPVERPQSPDENTAAGDRKPTNVSAPVSLANKCLMCACFALVTPVGMAIGLGVLNTFNGNDPPTIIAIGTLDALSAGILTWAGVVSMWADDWMGAGEMARTSPLETATGMVGLLGGGVLMSFLGKWA